MHYGLAVLEQLQRNERFVFALKRFASPAEIADIEPTIEDVVDMASRNSFAKLVYYVFS